MHLRFIKSHLMVLMVTVVLSACAQASHPNLVITEQDVVAMRVAAKQPSRFSTAVTARQAQLDEQIQQPIVVPVPRDGGGGYTHE